MTHAKLI